MVCELRGGTVENAMVRWDGSMDDEGHREYTLVLRVRADGYDGPANVLQTPGLPTPSFPWVVRADIDLWAWFYPTKTVKRYKHEDGEKTRWWEVELKASTKPPKGKKCQDAKIEDPLLEPMKVSGGVNHYREEATHDRFLYPLLYSSHEQIRGPAVEFEAGYSFISIDQNVPFLELELCSSMMNTVNVYPLWGMPRRCVAMTGFQWEKKWWGQCYAYYTRKFDFEVRARKDPYTGVVTSKWDRDVMDEGHRALSGKWQNGRWELENINGSPPNPSNPLHFVRLQDKNGNLVKIPLNGSGMPAGQVLTFQRESTGQYISIVNGNLNQSLANGAKWIAILGAIPPVVTQDSEWEWSRWVIYRKGNIVTWVNRIGFFNNADTGYYLRTGGPSTPDETTPVGQEEGPYGAGWLLLPNGPINLGDYTTTTTYDLGQFVTDSGLDTLKTGSGFRHIEYYGESDFFYLGIPAIL